MNGLTQLLKAFDFAAKKHKRQRRKGANGDPYINHPLEVANILSDIGKIGDYDILIAAVLHDVLEDTDTSEEELSGLFGETVCALVLEVTDDKTLPKAKRKELQIAHAPGLSQGAKLIKLADKISNIADIAENPPENWSAERRLDYIDWGKKVVSGVRGINGELEAAFDKISEKARTVIFSSG